MPAQKRNPKLLLIHSSIITGNFIHSSLTCQGYNLTQITYSQDITKTIINKSPDLIIIDLKNNPDEENLLIRRLQQNPYTHTIPLLIIIDFTNAKITFNHLINYNVDFISTFSSDQEFLIRIQRLLSHEQLEAKVQKENQKLKTALAYQDKRYAIIAHDLRAPISTIKMLNTTLAPQIQNIDNRYILTLFNMIQETTDEALSLLENLLNWMQTQYGKTKIYATKFDISEAIHQTVLLFQAHLSQKKIALREHTKQMTEVYADVEMIKTVLRNLISNAIKFTYPGGKIDITASRLSECTLVCVKDSGKGISSAEQKIIRKSNAYLTTYGTHNEKGYGLGLNISREFILLNKGKFWFSSQEGMGTTFFFTLPHPVATQKV